MSRIDEPSVSAPNIERTAEVASRMGVTREAARAEMEKFLGVTEYETRKILGHHSALKQPGAPVPETQPTRSKPAVESTDVPQIEKQEFPAPETPAPLDATVETQPVTPEQPEPTES